MTAKAKTGRKTRHHDYWPSEQRQEIVKQLFADLDEWEKNQAPEYIAQIMATHDRYHGTNPKHIARQDPNATDVDTYKAWVERGRRVMGKGYDIRIVRPIGFAKVDDPANPGQKIEVPTGYDYYPVYDIRHTVVNDPAVIKQWKADHPEGQW